MIARAFPVLASLAFWLPWAEAPAQTGPFPSPVAPGGSFEEVEPFHEREKVMGLPVEKPGFNFSFVHPGEGWKGVKPARLHPLAAIAFERGDAEMFCAVVPLALGEGHGDNDLARLSFVQSMLSGLSRYGAIDEHHETRETAGGLRFDRVELVFRPVFAGIPLRYEHWIALHQGFCWQVIVWALPEKKAELAGEARRLAAGFRILDPARRSAQLSGVMLEDVNRPDLGFSTNFQGSGWRGVADRSGYSPLVSFAAERPGAGLTLTAVRFDEDLPDQEALIRGLLATAGFDYPQGGNFSVSPYGTDGSEITVKREAQDFSAFYLMRVIRGKKAAHLLTGWVQMNPQTVDMSHLRDGLDCFTILEVPETAPAPKLDAWQQGEVAGMLNQIGLGSFYAKDWEKAAHWCARAFRMDPTKAPYLQNAVMALENAGKSAEALALVRPYLDKFEDSPALAAQMGLIAAKGGEVDAAAARYLKLLEGGYDDEASLLEWLGILLQRQLPALALKMTEAYAKKHPTQKGRQWLAEMALENGDAARAVSLLEQLAEEFPEDDMVLLLLGEACNLTGDFVRSSELAEKLLAKARTEARIQMMHGWSQMGRKRYREARSSFEEAAKQAPENQDVQRAVTMASAMLGQGSNSGLKEPVEPVPYPAELERAVTARMKVPEGAGKGHALVYELRSVGFFHEPGKPRRTTERRRVRILTKEGADFFSTVEMPFDPVYERIYVNRVRVRDADGKEVPQTGLDAAYIRDQQDGGIADQKKVLHLQISGVNPGCVVEYEITQEDRAADGGFRFERRPFGHAWPVMCDLVYVAGAPDGLRTHLKNGAGVEQLKSPGCTAWLAVQPALLKPEPMARALEHYAPLLCLGGGEKDWATVGRDYLKDIEDRIKPDAMAAEVAERLTKGLASDREKVAALTRYVQRELNYKAIEFGVRARRPNSAAETLSHRYGDCKDHSLLLHQLLNAAGVPSRLALIHQSWSTVPELPTLDQFDHMIVHVPSLGPAGYVDATEKYLDASVLPPMAVWRNQPFVLDPAGPALAAVAKPMPGSSEVESHRTVTTEGPDDLRVEEEVTFRGYSASAMRSSLAAVEPSRQLQAVQAHLSSYGSIELQNFSFEHLEDIQVPATFRLTYLVRNAITQAEGRRSLILPAFWERNYLETTYVKDRTTPFEWILPTTIVSEVRLKLPEALPPMLQAGFTGRDHSAYNSWEMKFTPGAAPDEGLFQYRFQAVSTEGGAPQYQAFHEAWRGALKVWTKPVIWGSQRP